MNNRSNNRKPPPPANLHPQTSKTITSSHKNQAITSSHNEPSLGRTMMEGVAFGTGSSIAREVVNRTLSESTVSEQPPVKEDNKNKHCERLGEQLNECMMYGNHCEDLFDKYMAFCTK